MKKQDKIFDESFVEKERYKSFKAGFIIGLIIGIVLYAIGLAITGLYTVLDKDTKISINNSTYRILDYNIKDKQVILDVYKLKKSLGNI